MKVYSYDINTSDVPPLTVIIVFAARLSTNYSAIKIYGTNNYNLIFFSKTFVTFGKFSSFTRLYIHAQVYNVTERCYLHPHIVTYFITGKVATLFMLVLLGFLLKKRFKFFLWACISFEF